MTNHTKALIAAKKNKKDEFYTLMEDIEKELKYSPEQYQKYDNAKAIEVSKIIDIPYNYNWMMGVPITFLWKYNPEQFEIVGFRKWDDGKDLSINGICPYFRILICRKIKIYIKNAIK